LAIIEQETGPDKSTSVLKRYQVVLVAAWLEIAELAVAELAVAELAVAALAVVVVLVAIEVPGDFELAVVVGVLDRVAHLLVELVAAFEVGHLVVAWLAVEPIAEAITSGAFD